MLTKEELLELESQETVAGDTKYWLPIFWAVNLLNEAHARGLIKSEMLLNTAIQVQLSLSRPPFGSDPLMRMRCRRLLICGTRRPTC